MGLRQLGVAMLSLFVYLTLTWITPWRTWRLVLVAVVCSLWLLVALRLAILPE